jgi:hypothetical protein
MSAPASSNHCEREFLSPRVARGAVLAGGSGTLRTGEIAPHLRFVKTGPESSRIELANAGQLTVNRELVFTMSLESLLLDLRRPAVHCTRRPPRRERMACRSGRWTVMRAPFLHIGE